MDLESGFLSSSDFVCPACNSTVGRDDVVQHVSNCFGINFQDVVNALQSKDYFKDGYKKYDINDSKYHILEFAYFYFHTVHFYFVLLCFSCLIIIKYFY